MSKNTVYIAGLLASGALSVVALTSCTTTAAKQAMGQPLPKDKYTGFDANAADASSRKAEKLEQVKDDMPPEKAVDMLVKYLTDKRRAYHDAGEEQLMYWGQKQGVGQIVARKVRPLLKNRDVEVRAPALRLTLAFGGNESIGDLIECLGDDEREIRSMAFTALKSRSHRDFGFDAAGGEIARAQSVQQFRLWWQAEKRGNAVQAPSVYETNPQAEPKIVTPAPSETAGADAGSVSKRNR